MPVDRVLGAPPGGPHFGGLVEAMRVLLDRFAGALPETDDVPALTARVEELADQLLACQVSEWHSASGKRPDLPGGGNILTPPIHFDEMTPERYRGRVVFRRFHLGINDAAHGGVLPLVFDDILGRLANSGGLPIARVAYLHVDYRSVARLGVEHHFEAEVSRIEGRKRWATSKLYNKDRLVAEAESLFVELKPDQP